MIEFSVVVVPEAKSYSAWCPDVDVASQGASVEDALANLREALQLHLECLSPGEIREMRRRQKSRLVTTLQVPLPA